MASPPRLRSLLLLLNLVVLLLPVAGLLALRVTESSLIRQTESEVIGQAALLGAVFASELAEEIELAEVGDYGLALEKPTAPAAQDPWAPFSPSLDLSRDPVAPPASDAVAGPEADPVARRAAERMSAVLSATQRLTLAGFRVLDHRGIVVATSGSELGLSLRGREEVERALQGDRVSLLRERANEELSRTALDSISRTTALRVIVALPVILGDRLTGVIVVGRTPRSLSQAIYERRALLGTATALLIAVVTAISLLTARTLSRPLRALVEQTERVQRGDYEALQPLARPGTQEVDRISRSVAAMARSLQERAEYIQAFAFDVSHEFKSPLTSIRGVVELLKDHLQTMDPAELERFLSMLDQDSARLERLVERLLELARADVAGTQPGSAPVASVLLDSIAVFRERGLSISVGELPDGRVAMRESALRSVLLNLLDNAQQHGGEGVEVKIDAAWRPDPAGGASALPRVSLDLSITDNGPGISDANLERVWERFFTTARESGGTGLGLAIVRSLVEGHGGRLECRSQAGQTEFLVVLPSSTAGGSSESQSTGPAALTG